MTPPKKLFLSAIRPEILNTPYVSENRYGESDIEYILAPIWHDAVKDPPKNGIYPCKWIGGFDWVACKFNNGKWLLWGDEVHPDLYFPLPEPPKEEK